MPPPGDIVKLVEDTATTVVTKVKSAAGVQKTPATTPDREPAVRPAKLPLLRHSAPAVRPVVAAAPDSWSLRADTRWSDLSPGLPVALAGLVARTPVVAGASAPASHAQNAAQADELAAGTSVVRAILVALSAAAAATVAVAHVTVARRVSR